MVKWSYYRLFEVILEGFINLALLNIFFTMHEVVPTVVILQSEAKVIYAILFNITFYY